MIVFILCCSVSKNEVNDKNLSKKVYMGKKYSLLPMRHMECISDNNVCSQEYELTQNTMYYL